MLFEFSENNIPSAVQAEWTKSVTEYYSVIANYYKTIYWSYVVLGFVSLGGLYLFYNWSRFAFIIWSVIGLSMIMIPSWSYESNLESIYTELGSLLHGAIIGLSFLGVVANEFKK